MRRLAVEMLKEAPTPRRRRRIWRSDVSPCARSRRYGIATHARSWKWRSTWLGLGLGLGPGLGLGLGLGLG